MQIDVRNFPHPVLSYFSDDYTNCLYQAIINTSVTKTKYRLSVLSKTSSKDLLEFAKAGLAMHALHVECPATRFRHIYKSGVEKFDIEIDVDDLDGLVYLSPLIVATHNISGYSSADFHADFGGCKFDIRKGDILAIDRDRSFIAQKEVDPLRKLPSIFTISKNHAENPPVMDIDADGHKVVVKLDISTFDAYAVLAKDAAMAPLLSSLVIIPALTELLALISEAEDWGAEQFNSKRWYQVLSAKLKALGYTPGEVFPDSAVCIAQQLIGQPLRQALSFLTASEEVEGDE